MIKEILDSSNGKCLIIDTVESSHKNLFLNNPLPEIDDFESIIPKEPFILITNLLFLYNPICKVIDFIHSLEDHCILVYHKDVSLNILPDLCQILSDMASTILMLESETRIRLIKKGKSGRIQHSLHALDSNQQWKKETVKNKPIPAALVKTVDPTLNLTFNLSLTESQKQTKNELQLPHFEKINHGTINYSVNQEGDVVDYSDDSDPDEDLEI